MKRWALLTVAAYILALVAFTLPLILICFGPPSKDASGGALIVYQQWSYWSLIGVMAFCQAMLLVVPVAISERRLKPRRGLLLPVMVTGFLAANLTFAGFLSGLCVLFRDKGLEFIAVFGEIGWPSQARERAVDLLHDAVGTTPPIDFGCGAIQIIGVCWLLWAMILYVATRRDSPEARISRATRWLLRGSILELLVAVPSHIIVRNRHDCCAPIGTFWGIATGFSIMLLCFGPGVFFLFLARRRQLQGQ
jgi:hypothetical protein